MQRLAETTIDQVRTAMKFSLWTWAAYWPAMGLMLLLGGMRDPVSVGVVAASGAAFGLLAASGALRASASRNVKEFLIERPIYLIAGFLLCIVAGAAVPTAANVGLGVFSGIGLASLLFLGYRLVGYVDTLGIGVFRAKADQMFLMLLIAIPAAAAVMYDAVVESGLGNPAASVAVVNYVGLAYPALLLLASRPLREPLQLSLRRKPGVQVRAAASAEASASAK